MKSWAIALSSAALSISCSLTAAQSVLGPLLPSGGLFNSPAGVEAPEAKPFGTDITQLPGKRVGSANIKGKWFHREIKRNVEFESVRVPQLFTSMLLDLQAEGRYTLDYQAYWGAVGNSPEARYASLEAHEIGRFSVSGSVLLLEADTIEISRQSRGKSTAQSLSNQRRAYLVRLDKSTLNVAGPCADYQVEAVCPRNRSVWFALRQLSSTAAGIQP
jgi:hypothetical protein